MTIEFTTKSKEKYIVKETYLGEKTFLECLNVMIDNMLEIKTKSWVK